jgi:hypothetical protein
MRAEVRLLEQRRREALEQLRGRGARPGGAARGGARAGDDRRTPAGGTRRAGYRQLRRADGDLDLPEGLNDPAPAFCGRERGFVKG